MKKTMLFNSGEEYEVWSDKNEEKEGGFDFLADRTCIITGTRKRNGRTFKGFEAFATYYCKSEITAIRRFIKAVEKAGFGNLDNDFECGAESSCNAYEDCGYVVSVEGEDGCWNIGYICYQDEVEEEITEETEETIEIPEEASADDLTVFERVCLDCSKDKKMFQYEIRFHIADCKECYQHWDTMSVNADCISNARYNAVKRIDNEFDYPFSAVDVIEIYTSAGKLVNQEFM